MIFNCFISAEKPNSSIFIIEKKTKNKKRKENKNNEKYQIRYFTELKQTIYNLTLVFY